MDTKNLYGFIVVSESIALVDKENFGYLSNGKIGRCIVGSLTRYIEKGNSFKIVENTPIAITLAKS
jgi:hypothetical protein